MDFETTLGDMITAFYENFLDAYGDSELAAVATAATINEILGEAEVVETAQAA